MRIPRSLLSCIIFLHAFGFAVLGCRATSRTRTEPQPSPASTLTRAPEQPPRALDTSTLVDRYPPARWRLARTEELDRTLIWASQILIRHRDVTSRLASCEPPFWTPAPPPPERTREQAFELATQVARQAALEPDRFGELAVQYSEDVTTQTRGGRLGAVKPFASTSCPQILDAFAVLRSGEVSRVVETRYGFHVLRRHPPPPEQRLSGSRIVIGYDDAPWLARHLARRPIPPRSRAQALTLVTQIYEQAKHDPRSFVRLVEQYSEHEDAQRGGDFGSWSTREFTPFPREVQALTELAVGEISPPLDTLFGFQLILRTPERQRMHFAAERVELAFDPNLPPSSSGSESQVRKAAFAIARDLQRKPESLLRYQRQFCCVGVLSWIEGQDVPAYENALGKLGIDELTVEPVRARNLYTVLLRRAPAPVSGDRVQLELPAPEKPDLLLLALTAAGLEQFESAAKAAFPLLNLEGEKAARYTELIAIQARMAGISDEDAREGAFHEFQVALEKLLGQAGYQQFEGAVTHRLSESVIEQARNEPLPTVEAL